MVLKVLNSNSDGNCYILENDREALLIECGVHIKKIKRALDYNSGKVVGCLITHEHQDHCRAFADVTDCGIDVYTSEGTIGCLSVPGNYKNRKLKVIGGLTKIGSFTVMPFKVRHDATEPLGFLINHEETGNVLFLTDSFYVPYTFRNLHNIIVEANYSNVIMQERLKSGASPKIYRDRVLQSHMSIDTCCDLLHANDLTQVNNIVLIHLSDNNSNAEQFKARVQSQTGKNVHIAEAGLTIPFNKSPF